MNGKTLRYVILIAARRARSSISARKRIATAPPPTDEDNMYGVYTVRKGTHPEVVVSEHYTLTGAVIAAALAAHEHPRVGQYIRRSTTSRLVLSVTVDVAKSDDGESVLFTPEAVRGYLDTTIRYWCEQRDHPPDALDECRACHYVDAYHSMRLSLFGTRNPEEGR